MIADEWLLIPNYIFFIIRFCENAHIIFHLPCIFIQWNHGTYKLILDRWIQLHAKELRMLFQAAQKHQTFYVILLTKRNHVTVEEFSLTRICIGYFLMRIQHQWILRNIPTHAMGMAGAGQQDVLHCNWDCIRKPSMQFQRKKLLLLEVHGTLFLPLVIPQSWHVVTREIHYSWVLVASLKARHADWQWVQICLILCCHSYLINLHFNCRPLPVSVHIWSRKTAPETSNFGSWFGLPTPTSTQVKSWPKPIAQPATQQGWWI